MDAIDSCPACGQHNALIALGGRWDHPHRWRFWITALTHLYLCEECDALVEVRAARHSGQREGAGAGWSHHGVCVAV